MPSLEFFLVAQSLAVDQQSNRLSIFDVLDTFQPRSLPAVFPRLVAVSAWLLEPDDKDQDFQATLRVVFEGPQSPLEFAQNFQGTGTGQRVVHQLVGLQIAAPGRISFEIVLNGHAFARHRVVIMPPDSEAPDDGLLIPVKSVPQ